MLPSCLIVCSTRGNNLAGFPVVLVLRCTCSPVVAVGTSEVVRCCIGIYAKNGECSFDSVELEAVEIALFGVPAYVFEFCGNGPQRI